jgi:hypothetical protein
MFTPHPKRKGTPSLWPPRAGRLLSGLCLSMFAASARAEPIPASGAMSLPITPVERDTYTSFMGSPAISVEALGIYHFGAEAAGVRPMVNLALGPLSIGVGVLIADEVSFDAALDVFSYQSSGWRFAIGVGIETGGIISLGVPLIEGLRLRALTSLNFSGDPIVGLGVEAAPW